MKNQPFQRRCRFALAGLGIAWRRERSFRTQVLLAGAALAFLIILRPAPIWWAIVALTIALVLGAEALNSALETLIDHLHPAVHPEIRVVKDMAAGVVLLVSIGAVAVGIALIAAQF